MRGIQLKELALTMKQAAELSHVVCDRGLIANEVIRHQASPPVAQKVSGMFTHSGLARVVHHGLDVFESALGICQKVTIFGLGFEFVRGRKRSLRR